MPIYVIKGIKDGYHSTLLVTTNLEKAKAFLINDGFSIEMWEDDIHTHDIHYNEIDGFYGLVYQERE